MNKKVLKVIGLVIFVAVLTFIFSMPVIPKPVADTGTCCSGGSGTCVIGTYVQQMAWYEKSGPCP
jgi:hypothetical protein